MTLSRRRMLTVIGGGTIVAASAATTFAVTRKPSSAHDPWISAGGYSDPRLRALSYALLAPNPHNRQPWMVELARDDEVVLYADTGRLLPATDPFSRQITIGLGCFLELMRMAAAEDGYRVELDPFPAGEDVAGLDRRPVAHARFVADADVVRDPLFRHVMNRRSLKEPFDLTRQVPAHVLDELAANVTKATRFGGTVDAVAVGELRALSREALRIEIETPHTFQESVDLFRIGYREVDANPDGIDFTGPLFESLRLAGLFSLESAADTSSMAYAAGLDAVYSNIDTAMGHVWLWTAKNSRRDQLAAGADWVRINLAATAVGLGIQPLSQALQEYSEMAALYREVHERLAPDGGTVQMFARIGYGPTVGPSPRWPLEAKIVES